MEFACISCFFSDVQNFLEKAHRRRIVFSILMDIMHVQHPHMPCDIRTCGLIRVLSCFAQDDVLSVCDNRTIRCDYEKWFHDPAFILINKALFMKIITNCI